MTDLENFVNLYRSFGIECNVNIAKDGTRVIYFERSSIPNVIETVSDKFHGHTGFFSQITFDAKGKFISQGFWE
jgi:CMP-2-keto-3-deoxyoctulosonic acid synthetase